MKTMLIKFSKQLFKVLLCLCIGVFVRYWIEEYKRTGELCEPENNESLCHADSLRLKVISIGDLQSYLELRDSFTFSAFPHELLFYSIVMAKQYGYKPAYSDASKSLKAFYSYPNMQPMDSFTDSVYNAFLHEASK